MSQFTESLMQLLGREPTRPAKDSISPAVREVMLEKRKVGLKKADLRAVEAAHALKPKQWRRRRWITLILVNLLFLVSYKLDIQLLEGALTASRFVGFHMADLNSALQVMLAYKHVVLNLMIGTATVLILWILLGGRTFCAWACPYHLLSEWAENIHLWLVAKKIIKNRTFDRRVRTVFYVIFILLALLTGYTVFETISPTGILSRALIYGPGIALLWVLALLMFEVFVSRRAWCRYVCPIGMTYGFVGLISPVQVKYNIKNCHHEGDCRAVCLVPHVLSMTIKGRSPEENMNIGADCTRCGMCVDICPTDSLNFDIKGLNKIL
jgi:ferredoxin-type protein NapH